MMLKGEWGKTRGLCDEILQTADWPICGDQLVSVGHSKAIVYGFGIADDYDFEAACGMHGMKVYGFDPTRKYKTELAPNVTFLNWGLGPNKPWSHRTYGDIVGKMFELEEIMDSLGHSKVDVLKLDCEGCEWEALGRRRKRGNYLLDSVGQINIEMHFTKSLRVDNSLTVKYMAETFKALRRANFVPWYIFPQGGSRNDRKHLPVIKHFGFPTNLCCFELGFIKTPAAFLTRSPLLKRQRSLVRPASYYKWGQVWSNGYVEHVSHSELSRLGRGLTNTRVSPLRMNHTAT